MAVGAAPFGEMPSPVEVLQGIKELMPDAARHVPDQHVSEAAVTLRELIDDLIGLGPSPDEKGARDAVAKCVCRFNELDDGWIMTIEREDLAEAICDMVELAGFECDEDWLDDREW